MGHLVQGEPHPELPRVQVQVRPGLGDVGMDEPQVAAVATGQAQVVLAQHPAGQEPHEKPDLEAEDEGSDHPHGRGDAEAGLLLAASPEAAAQPGGQAFHERLDRLQVHPGPLPPVDGLDLGDRAWRLEPGQLAHPHLCEAAGFLEGRTLVGPGTGTRAPHLGDRLGDLPGDLPVDRAALDHEEPLQLPEEGDRGECGADLGGVDVHTPSLRAREARAKNAGPPRD